MNQILAVFGSMNIENKTLLVTGSTDGVGRLVARRLADQGARVLIHGRDRTRGEQLRNEIRAANRGSAAFYPQIFPRSRRCVASPTPSARTMTG